MISRDIEIRLVDYGLANNFGSYIEINKELQEDEKLYNYVLKHELNHTDKIFSVKDMSNDLKINLKMAFKLLFFVVKRPKLWYEFLPVYKRKGKDRFVIDINMILLYCISAILIMVLIVMF